MTDPIRLAIAGMGKIARDQHVPAIEGGDTFTLVAAIEPAGAVAEDVPTFPDVAALAASGVAVDAVAVCTPPQHRRAVADAALAAGWHVLLEKPPASTLAEVAALESRAREHGRTLFTAWHSRFAAGVGPAREWLAGKTIRSVAIEWREDVRVWHPGQAWIFASGGMGVFDPGINALSILTLLLGQSVWLEGGTLDMPANAAAPIAGSLDLRTAGGAPVAMGMDFLQTGPQTWTIAVETDAGRLVLEQGGSVLTLPDGSRHEGPDAEYPSLYAEFARLIAAGQSAVDTAPLMLVADAMLRCERRQVEPFIE